MCGVMSRVIMAFNASGSLRTPEYSALELNKRAIEGARMGPEPGSAIVAARVGVDHDSEAVHPIGRSLAKQKDLFLCFLQRKKAMVLKEQSQMKMFNCATFSRKFFQILTSRANQRCWQAPNAPLKLQYFFTHEVWPW